jgi:hypothetical protein
MLTGSSSSSSSSSSNRRQKITGVYLRWTEMKFLDLMSDRLYALLLAVQVIITFGLLLNIEE